MDRKALGRLARMNKECGEWAEVYLRVEHRGGYTMRPADVRAGLQVGMLQHFVRIEGARVVLPPAVRADARG